MKKILSLALVALMALPFGMFASAATITVPAEPTATNNTVVYTAYDYNEGKTLPAAATTNDGATTSTMYKTSAFSSWLALFREDAADAALGAAGKLKDGGNFVIVGKALAGLGNNWNYQGVIPATTAPIVITGKDPANGTSYVSMQNGEIYYTTETGANAGQYGMFMMDSGTETQSNTLVFEGDVIFKDTVILNRTSKTLADAGKLAPTISAKSKIVIDATVKFASMTGNQKYTLNVADGAYAYLHALGFGKYTGTGVIVIGDEIKNAVTEDMFADFEGKIVDKNGVELFADDNQGGNNNQGGNPETGDMSLVLVALAAVSAVSAGAVLTLKKREER